MFMKNASLISFIAWVLLGSVNVYAAEEGNYIDISYGITSQTVDVKNSTAIAGASNTRTDDESEGYALVVGASFSENFAAEFSYINLGEMEIIGDDVHDGFSLDGTEVQFTGAETITREINGFGFGFATKTSGEGIQGALRAGAFWWDTTGTKADSTDSDTWVNSVLFDNGIDPYVGINLKYNFDRISVGAGYDTYGINSYEDTATLMSLSIGGIF